jgi:hypothetical protein
MAIESVDISAVRRQLKELGDKVSELRRLL